MSHRIMESNNMRYRKTTTEKLGRGMERSKEGVTFLFCDIGKFSLSYIIKSALRSDAHSHERQMSAKADHARRSKSVLLGRKWNCEGVRSTLLFCCVLENDEWRAS